MYWNNGSVNIWLRLNQHNFNPRNSHICWIIIRNHICLIVPQGGIVIKRSGILLCIFWYTNIWKICPGRLTYANAHANVKKWIIHIWLPRYWFEFGIIWNDFWSSTTWAIQLQASFTEFNNLKNPGIQPSDIYEFKFGNDSWIMWSEVLLECK